MRYLFFFLATTLLAADPFAVKVTGNPTGHPVILIPGLSSSGAVWDDTVRHLAAKYQCHTLTLAGFAGQPRLGDGPFLANVRDAIIQYVETNKLKKPMFVGHSLGGHMALWIASQRPDLAGPLVIVDSLPHLGALMFPDPASLEKQAAGMRMMIASQPRDQYNSYVRNSGMIQSMVGEKGQEAVTSWSLTSDPIAVANAMYDLYTTDLRDAIAKIQSKTLVLGSWVAYKQVSTKAKTQEIFDKQYEKMPTAKIQLSDTAKHFIMLDDPEWYLLQLDTFLK